AAIPAKSMSSAPITPRIQYAVPNQAVPMRTPVRRLASHGRLQTRKSRPSTSSTLQTTTGLSVNVQLKMPAPTNSPPKTTPRQSTPGRDTASAATAAAIRPASTAQAAEPALCETPSSTPPAASATTAIGIAQSGRGVMTAPPATKHGKFALRFAARSRRHFPVDLHQPSGQPVGVEVLQVALPRGVAQSFGLAGRPAQPVGQPVDRRRHDPAGVADQVGHATEVGGQDRPPGRERLENARRQHVVPGGRRDDGRRSTERGQYT